MLLWLYHDHSHDNHLRQAYNAYQAAVYIDDRSNTVWMSVALFYFYIQQYFICLVYITESIRLDPYEPLVWRNLGILVSSNFSSGQRCLQLILALSTTVKINKKM